MFQSKLVFISRFQSNCIILLALGYSRYCHFTTPEILLADLFFLTYFTFTTWLLCTTFCFFSSFAILYSFTIYYLFFRNQIELFRASHRACSFPHRVRRRLLFVTLCSSRFMILPITTTTGWRDERSSLSPPVSRDIPLISFQCGKAKVVSDGGDQGFERLRSRFRDIFFFFASGKRDSHRSISVSDM